MTLAPTWSHEVVLPADPVSVSLARDFVAMHLIGHDLTYLVEDVRLVASELATNALTHAQTPFVVALSGTDASVLLAVRDGSTSMPAGIVATSVDLNGRGLMIVEMLSSDWGVRSGESGSKSVWACFASPSSS